MNSRTGRLSELTGYRDKGEEKGHRKKVQLCQRGRGWEEQQAWCPMCQGVGAGWCRVQPGAQWLLGTVYTSNRLGVLQDSFAQWRDPVLPHVSHLKNMWKELPIIKWTRMCTESTQSMNHYPTTFLGRNVFLFPFKQGRKIIRHSTTNIDL